MVLSILFLNRFLAEVETHEEQTELILSLGGTPKQAIHRQLIAAIKASTIPTIESQKTIGFVQLPGMMSGQIIAGADPVQAVQFQLLILFLLLTTAVLSSVMLGYLSYPVLSMNGCNTSNFDKQAARKSKSVLIQNVIGLKRIFAFYCVQILSKRLRISGSHRRSITFSANILYTVIEKLGSSFLITLERSLL